MKRDPLGKLLSGMDYDQLTSAGDLLSVTVMAIIELRSTYGDAILPTGDVWASDIADVLKRLTAEAKTKIPADLQQK